MSEQPIPKTAPDFETASKEVLSYLHKTTEMSLWMLTRVVGEDWVVLTADDHGYGVESGNVFNWSDSFCSHMVCDLAPRVACDADRVPAYRDAPIGDIVDIGSYVGVPLRGRAGELFGTLCAIDPERKTVELEACLPVVELMARLLSGILHVELKVEEADRAMSLACLELVRDDLTGLANKRAWVEAIDAEEIRCARHGRPASVVFVDLNDLKVVNSTEGHAAGDILLRDAASTIRAAVRGHAFAARIGGDEFAILASECDAGQAEMLGTRLRHALTATGIRAAVGWATRHPETGLRAAVDAADRRMFEDKMASRAMLNSR